jgi:hypothetical protein
MRIAAHKILFLVVPLQLCLMADRAGAQDSSGPPEQVAPPEQIAPPKQIAKSVEGSSTTPAPNAGSYAIQNDLLTGPSISAEPVNPLHGGWMAPARAPGLAEPTSEKLADLDDEVDLLVDPNEPRTIQLSDRVRGKLKAKGGGAMLGISIGFW